MLQNHQHVKMSAEQIVRMDEFSLLKYIKRAEVESKHRKAAISIQRWWREVRPSKALGIRELVPYLKAVSKIGEWYKGLL